MRNLSSPGFWPLLFCWLNFIYMDFLCGSAGKESTCNVQDLGSISGLGRSPGEEKGYPLQYSGLENSLDFIVHGVTMSQTWLSDFHFHFWSSQQLQKKHLVKSNSQSQFKNKLGKVGICVCLIASVLSDSLWPHGLCSPWNYPGQNTGVGSLSLLQGIFPTQGSNSGLPHCRQILYQLSQRACPGILEWVAYPFAMGSSQPRNQIGVSCIAGGFFTKWAIREAQKQKRKGKNIGLLESVLPFCNC